MRHVVLPILMMLIAGQGHAEGRDPDQVTHCRIGSTCTLTGTLVAKLPSHGQTNQLETDEGCLALALPRSIGVGWNGHRVRVAGELQAQPSLPPPDVLMWYDLHDRRMSTGVCPAGPVMYVTKIEDLGHRN